MEIEDRLESLILRVGEKSTSSLESNLEGLASVLEADLSTYKSKILKILVECAVKLPDKCTIYTTLIGLLNTKNYNFGGECVEMLVKHLKVNKLYDVLFMCFNLCLQLLGLSEVVQVVQCPLPAPVPL